MNIRRNLLFGILFCTVILSVGCYLEADNDAVSSSAIVIDMQNQAPLGYDEPGWYIKAWLYDAGVMDTMLGGPEPLISLSGSYLYYFEPSLSTPLDTQAFFLGVNSRPFGSIIIADLPSNRKYRILLEKIEYYGPGEYYVYYASITDEFEVTGSSYTELEVTMYYHC